MATLAFPVGGELAAESSSRIDRGHLLHLAAAHDDQPKSLVKPEVFEQGTPSTASGLRETVEFAPVGGNRSPLVQGEGKDEPPPWFWLGTQMGWSVVQDSTPSEINVHYLGGNSWAVRVGHRLLVFDYVAAPDVTAPTLTQEPGLPHGRIGRAELDSLDLFVFVSHQHSDHYDARIHEWRGRARSIHYIFGWHEGRNPADHYLVGPRSSAEFDGLSISTVNSNQDGVPEVAFLVQVDGWVIYHNGDYRGDIDEDFAFLGTIAERVDLAFLVSGWPQDDHPLFGLTQHFVEILRPAHVFLIDRVGLEYRTETFAQFLTNHGTTANFLHGDLLGDSFLLSRDSVIARRRGRR